MPQSARPWPQHAARIPLWLRYLLMSVFAFAVIAIRRWPQFTDPAIWIEEATQVLPSLIQSGWRGIFTPIGGYLIVSAKLVSYIALWLSFPHYTIVATVLATAVQAACVGVIACARTALPAPLACALAVIFVPIGVEVFAIPLHTFWWVALLLFVALLSREDARQWTRLACLAAGGLSSPLVVPLAPLFIVRAIVLRRRADMVASGLAVALAILQAAVILSVGSRTSDISASLLDPALIVAKYLGTALYGLAIPGPFALPFGAAVLVVIVGGFFAVPRRDRLFYGLLVLGLGASIAASIARVAVFEPHPFYAGPRYFFYPAVTLLWLLIWLAARTPRLGIAAALLIGAHLPALALGFDWAKEVPVKPWTEQVRECAATQGSYTFQAQFDPMWNVAISGDDCRRLVRRSLHRY